jgi:hypothetical protein
MNHLITQLALTREYSKFWKSHLELPFYYKLRTIYAGARFHSIQLLKIEHLLTNAIGEVYLLMAVLDSVDDDVVVVSSK